MAPNKITALLLGGDRRSIGRSDQIVSIVSDNPKLFAQLIAGLWSTNRLVRMRTADAAEKITRKNGDLLAKYRKELLGLMAESKEQEVCWHLAVIVPRLALSSRERQLVASLLRNYLGASSSIVKTFALQGLADLAQNDPSIRPTVIDILREAGRKGTPAMKARSRKLLAQLERA